MFAQFEQVLENRSFTQKVHGMQLNQSFDAMYTFQVSLMHAKLNLSWFFIWDEIKRVWKSILSCLLISEQRIDDIKYWKKELDDKLCNLVTEIDSLIAFKARVEKALEATAEPLHIAKQCLLNR